MISRTMLAAMLFWVFVFCASAGGAEFNKRVPIASKGTTAFYIDGHIEGFGKTQLLVDTGSGYTAIDAETLAVLKKNGRARYLRDLRGIMADGSQRTLPVYMIESINLGGQCTVYNVEAAVFPSRTRMILGLTTLKKVSPFIFSIDPPSLMLSCPAATARATPVEERI